MTQTAPDGGAPTTADAVNRPWWGLALILLAVVVLCFGAAYTIYWRTLQTQLQAEYDRLRGQGLPVSPVPADRSEVEAAVDKWVSLEDQRTALKRALRRQGDPRPLEWGWAEQSVSGPSPRRPDLGDSRIGRFDRALAEGESGEVVDGVAWFAALSKAVMVQPDLGRWRLSQEAIDRAAGLTSELLQAKPAATVSPQRWADLQRCFEAHRGTQGLLRALAGARAKLIEAFDRGEPPVGSPELPFVYGWSGSGLMALDEMACLRLFKEAEHRLENPLRVGLPTSETLHPNRLVARRLAGILERAHRLHLDTQATLARTLAAIALRRYAIEHGRFPEDLGQLVPAFLEAVPLEPRSGDLLSYRVEPGVAAIGPKGDGQISLRHRLNAPDAQQDR